MVRTLVGDPPLYLVFQPPIFKRYRQMLLSPDILSRESNAMPTIQANGINVNYSLEGPTGATMVTLSNSLLSNYAMWDAQISVLTKKYRVLRYDTRGHGGTEVTPGPYSFELLTEDVYALHQALGIEKTHFVGLSMGGMIGQLLAVRHPELLHSVTLCDTTSKMPHPEIWDGRIEAAQSGGVEAVVEGTLERWFTPAMHEGNPDEIARIAAMIRGTKVEGFIANCQAIKAMDQTGILKEITTPTLIIVGAEDPATTPDMSRIIHAEIEGSELAILPNASHLANVEQPQAFNDVLMNFLSAH